MRPYLASFLTLTCSIILGFQTVFSVCHAGPLNVGTAFQFEDVMVYSWATTPDFQSGSHSVSGDGDFWDLSVSVNEANSRHDVLTVIVKGTDHHDGPHDDDNAIDGIMFTWTVEEGLWDGLKTVPYGAPEQLSIPIPLGTKTDGFDHSNEHFDFWSAQLFVTAGFDLQGDLFDISRYHILIGANHVPEPSTYILFAIGILGIIGMSYRQRKKAG